MQPAIFALFCVVFKISFREVPPPIHPKTVPDVLMVLSIEDSCDNIYDAPMTDGAPQKADVKTPRVQGRSPRAIGNSPRALVRSMSVDSRGAVIDLECSTVR